MHAPAPGAHIALVQTYSQDWKHLQAAQLDAITNHPGASKCQESLTIRGTTTNYSAIRISSPLDNNTTFVSAWWNTP